MLKQKANLRQAEESAAPATVRQFKSPQHELRWLREHRQDLPGFVRALELLESARFFKFRQAEGDLPVNWLNQHDNSCKACVGAVLHWFFASPRAYGRVTGKQREWNYARGSCCLADHLEISPGALDCELSAIIEARPGFLRKAWWRQFGKYDPFGPVRWPTGYAGVFRELARRYPNK